MSKINGRRRWSHHFAAVCVTLSAPVAASAQEQLFVSCEPTALWHEGSGNGNWGLQFTIRIRDGGIAIWRPENRSWGGLHRCADNALRGTTAVCQMALSDGEASYTSFVSWGDGTRTRDIFKVSRVTGQYHFLTTNQQQTLLYEETGVCSAIDNPETQATQRAF